MYKILLLSLLTMLCLLQYRMWFGEANMLQVSNLQLDIKQQYAENNRLLLRNYQLEAEVNDLRQGSVAIEERARSELGMVKPDEIFYQIVNTPTQ